MKEQKRIYQLVAHPQKKDAIGRMAVGLHRLLSKHYKALLFTEKKSARGGIRKGLLKKTPQWGAENSPELCFFQHSTGSVVADRFLEWPSEKKFFIYQNITPVHLLEDSRSKENAEWGLEQLKKLISVSEFAIGTSRFNCEELEKMGAQNVVQIPYYLPKRFSPFSRKKTPTVLMVSRVEPYKGMLEGIQSFAIAKEKIPELQMVIVGNLKANPKYVQKLRNEISNLKIEKSVKLIGRISDFWMDYYYSRALCLLVLSEHEGFGVPIVEAHRWKVPVIGLDRGAVSETMGAGGLLLGDKNPQNVADQITFLSEIESIYESIQDEQESLAAQSYTVGDYYLDLFDDSQSKALPL